MITKYVDNEHCTGCGLCSNVCVDACIRMQEDAEGFFMPSVDDDRCKGCMKCVAACPVLCRAEVHRGKKEVYAAFSLEKSIQYESTSGGIFYELARYILEHDGCVAAVRYGEDFLPEHVLIRSLVQLRETMQSKYAQSRTGDIYKQVEKQLKTGQKVLFVGTPCQCAALKKLTGENANLIVCDFICRGVNSPLVYRKYLEAVQKENKGRDIRRVWFKNKTYGWNRFSTKIEFTEGEPYLQDRDHDLFMKGYIKRNLNLYMRKSCGNCGFKGYEHESDITLGDFWGINMENMPADAQYGVSCVIIHSLTGKRLFENIKGNLYAEEHTMDEVIPCNRCLLEAAPAGVQRQEFFRDICAGKDFFEIMEKIGEK